MSDKEDLELVKVTLQRLLNQDGFNEVELGLIDAAADGLLHHDKRALAKMLAAATHRSNLWRATLLYLIEYYAKVFEVLRGGKAAVSDLGALIDAQAGMIELLKSQLVGNSRLKTDWGKLGADTLHSRPDGSREKRAKVLEAWATGRYPNKDICAEKEAERLEISFSTARKALRNAPAPLPTSVRSS